MNDLAAEIINAKDGDPAQLRRLNWKLLTGTVTDDTTTPATVACDGGSGIPTVQVAGYCPTDDDPVVVMSAQGTRIMLGQAGGNGHVILTRAANQSATGSAAVTVSWDTETLDIGGWWTSGTTLTVPTGYAGVYAIHTRAIGAGTWTSATHVLIQVSGVNVGMGHANGQVATLPANSIVRLSDASTIQVVVRNAGATQNMTAVIGVHRIA